MAPLISYLPPSHGHSGKLSPANVLVAISRRSRLGQLPATEKKRSASFCSDCRVTSQDRCRAASPVGRRYCDEMATTVEMITTARINSRSENARGGRTDDRFVMLIIRGPRTMVRVRAIIPNVPSSPSSEDGSIR